PRPPPPRRSARRILRMSQALIRRGRSSPRERPPGLSRLARRRRSPRPPRSRPPPPALAEPLALAAVGALVAVGAAAPAPASLRARLREVAQQLAGDGGGLAG